MQGSAQAQASAVIIEGNWKISPLYIQGSVFPVTHCSPNKIMIGCECHTFSEWLKNGLKIARTRKLTKRQISEYLRYVKLIIALNPPKLRGKS
jgi:hypothetical protein